MTLREIGEVDGNRDMSNAHQARKRGIAKLRESMTP